MFVGTWAPPCQDRCPYIHSSAEPKSARAARPQRKERVPWEEKRYGFQIYIYMNINGTIFIMDTIDAMG